MTKTLITAITVFALVVAVVVGGWGIATVKAQSSTPPPLALQGLTVGNGPNPGTATLAWTAISGASSYRIGRLSDENYQAYADTWRERFAYSDVTATSAFTLTGLIPGGKYYFIVGQNHSGGVAWSSWVELTLNSDSQSCPTATAPTPQPTPTPTLGPTPTPRPTPTGAGDYDADKDGLIEISNLAQLDAIRWDLDGNGVSHIARYADAFPDAMFGMGCPDGCVGYELVADLDFDTNGNGQADEGDIYWNDGEGWVPIGSQNHKFGAAFDGWGYSISNLYINQGEDVPVGLFGSTGSNSNIKRVGLVSVSVSGNDTAGGLAGDHSGAITNSYTTGNVSIVGKYAGGLVGINSGTISNTYSFVDVSGSTVQVNSAGIGGLVGSNNGGTIDYSYATGSVYGNVYGDGGTGGLVGENFYGRINTSYAIGDVSGNEFVGGLAGSNEGVIKASYAIGAVNGSKYIGGLIGFNDHASITAGYAAGRVSGSSQIGGLVGLSQRDTITASYANGNVSGGDDVGGLVGRLEGGTITKSYAIGTVSGSDYLGGMVGYNDGGAAIDSYWNTETTGQPYSAAGVGKTTDELQSPTAYTGSYADWNVDIDGNGESNDPWDFGTSTQYPVLKYGGLDIAAQRP